IRGSRPESRRENSLAPKYCSKTVLAVLRASAKNKPRAPSGGSRTTALPTNKRVCAKTEKRNNRGRLVDWNERLKFHIKGRRTQKGMAHHQSWRNCACDCGPK